MNLNICRLCGENEGTIYVFSQCDKLPASAKIIHCCPNVNVVEGDGLPANICVKCGEELDAVYRFVVKCEVTDQRLRSHASIDRASTLTTINEDEENYTTKVEVKLEEQLIDESPCDDLDDEEHKEEIPMKSEGNKTKAKRTYNKKNKDAEVESYKCSVCGHKSTTSSSLTVHMRNHTDERPFCCHSCDKKYKDQGGLKRHIDRNHFVGERERNYMCENCGRGFYTRNDVRVHMRTHTGETPYPCPECPLKFTQISSLVRHKRRHAGEKPHSCDTCGKQFCTKEELKYHLDVHTDVKKFACSVCNIPFKYKNNLRKHMVKHSRPNSFVCTHCGLTFHQQSNLKGHMRRQHSEKSGYCNVCSKSVPNIEVHTWKHTGQKPLKCDQCTSTFSTFKTLGRHINYKHKQTDKFKCTFENCGMHFPARAMLELHFLKQHENNIPFPCNRCSRGFYRKNDLARHKLGTHKERLES